MAARDFRTRLNRRAAKNGLFLPDDLVGKLQAYFELLSRWNQKINLTSLTNPDEAIDRLLLEPLVASRYLPAGNVRLMDIGSGGGSPAIPLKLAAPAVDLTMVEVKSRKSAFLREAIRHLDLANALVETARYEELLARPGLHESFGVLTLRAVRVEPRVMFTLQAFLKSGGQMLLFRGSTGPVAPDVVPPLQWVATHPLVDSLMSRLTILQKRAIGA